MDKKLKQTPAVALPWFRYYNGALNSPRVQALDPFYFKAWVNLLCVASQGDGRVVTCDIPFRLRVTKEIASEILEMLEAADLLVNYGDHYIPVDWEIRQYKSDTSAVRMRKHRERKKALECDVTVTEKVTPPEQSRAEQKQIRTEKDIPVKKPEGVSQEVWNDFVKHRKNKKAQISETAMKGFIREAGKAGIPLEEALSETIVRGWVGFKADWYDRAGATMRPQKTSYMDDMINAGRAANETFRRDMERKDDETNFGN